MTLFASLKVSTLGLNAQGTKMGAISDNIANVNTVGYKRTDVQFSTLVTERIKETRFTPGGVTARPRQTVDQAGQLLGTGINTDFAVSGRGMFIVTEEATFTPSTSSDGLAYTRAGSFRADSDGNLVNTAGYYLQGWTVNRNGEVTLDGANPATINNSPSFADLQPVNVNRFSNIAEQTENFRIRANLPNDFTVTDALNKSQIDPRSPFVIQRDLDAGGVRPAIESDDVIIANGVADPDRAGFPFEVQVTIDGVSAPVSFTTTQLATAGFDPGATPPTNTASDFVTALNGLSTTAATGETVALEAELTAGGAIVVRGTVNGAAADVTAVRNVEIEDGFAYTAVGGAVAFAGGTITVEDTGAPANSYIFDIPAVTGLAGNTPAQNAALVAAAINTARTSTDGVAQLYAVVNGDDVEVGLYVNGQSEAVGGTLPGALGAITGAGATNALPPAVATGEPDINDAGTIDAGEGVTASTTVTFLNPTGAGTATALPIIGTSANNELVLTIDNQQVTFTLNNAYDGATAGSTVQQLVTDLNAASTTVNGATYTLSATLTGDGSILLVGRRDDQTAVIEPGFAGTSTIDYDGGAGAAAAVPPTVIDEGVSQGVGTVTPGSTSVTGTYDDVNTRRTQFELIIGASGSNGDFTTTNTVFDALGQAHQVQFQWYRYQSDVAGSNTWAVRLSDTGIDGVKTPLQSITDSDPTVDTDATVPRFITYNGSDGNDSLSENNVTQSQTLFMKFNGDGSLEGVYTDPLLDPLGRVATRTNTASDPLKMIQIAVGEVEIDAEGAAGSGVNENLAVAREINDNPNLDPNDPNFVASPFGTDGARALVFDWDVGRPTNVRTDQASASNVSFSGTGLDGLTQFDSGEATPTLETFFTSQDGLRAGVLTGVQLDEDGVLSAFFDNGAQRSIYKIPLVYFVNFNGLINESGNVYRESEDSGAAQINAAGQGFNGDLTGGALEQSNVELSDEFTEMIITQQSFTANTRAITTTDEMLTDINNMVR